MTNNTIPTAVEELDTDETVSSSAYTKEEKWIGSPYEEILLDPNSDFYSQTQFNNFNGHSGVLKPRVDHLLFSPPSQKLVRERFRALQKWEGYVLEVGSETFLARLVPIIGEGLDQEAEIYLDEIDEEDRVLVETGAIFYWSIGYLDGPSGRRRDSIIRFRRLPVWTKQELEMTRTESTKLRDLFDAG